MSSRVQKIFFVLGNVNEHRGILAKYHFVVSFPARLLAKLGVGPTFLNFAGLASGLVSAVLIARGDFFAAFILALIAAICDGLDGAVARQLGVASDFDNFVDSVADRYVDLSILLGILWHFAFQNQKTPALLAALALVGTGVTSACSACAAITQIFLLLRCSWNLSSRPRVACLRIGRIVHAWCRHLVL